MRWWMFGLVGGGVLLVATAVKFVRVLVGGVGGEGGLLEALTFAALLFGVGFACGVIVWAGRGLYRWIGLAGDAVVGSVVMIVFFMACMLAFSPDLLAEKLFAGGLPMLGMAVVLGAIGGAWTGRDVRKQLSTRRPRTPASGDESDEPRCHHYTLAHHALRHAALDQPLEFLATLSSRDATRFLSHILRQVSEHCRGREAGPGFGVDDITVHTVRAGKFPCAVIELPRPRATAEAHMVAAVLLHDADSPPGEGVGQSLRYFTLEKGMTLDGVSRTVLCEWTDEMHLNYGDGPPPEVPAFVAAVSSKLAAVGD
jgi:hypothetical protein